MDIRIRISMMHIWLVGLDESFFCLVGWMKAERTLMSPRRPRGGVNRPAKILLKQKLKLRAALPPFEGGTTFLQP